MLWSFEKHRFSELYRSYKNADTFHHTTAQIPTLIIIFALITKVFNYWEAVKPMVPI